MMKLLTKELEEKLPEYGSQEELPLEEHVFYVKYFCIMSNWRWYACEYDKKDRVFFGYVMGQENEWGDFSLADLESLGFVIERDLYFKPCTFAELQEEMTA
jgi:hypothetical protein